MVSPKLTVLEIVSASHGERGLLFLKQQSICSASEMKTNLSQLAMIVFCLADVKSQVLLSSSNDLAYFPSTLVNTTEASGHVLSLTTKFYDVATEDIGDALLTANTRGQGICFYTHRWEEHPFLCSNEETKLWNIFNSVQLGM